jgi:hypothetical protein
MLVTGFASTHFVKYSTVTIAKVYFPCAGVSLPMMSMPHRCRGQDVVINYGCAGALERWENFGQASQVYTCLAANAWAPVWPSQIPA